MSKARQWKELFDRAHKAGMAAGEAARPTPMVVGSPKRFLGDDLDPEKPMYYVPEGVCGFAWIVVRPGNSSFARWLKKHGHARRHYYGGVAIWVREFGQSYDRKVAYAGAFEKVLREAGIRATADGRLD